MSLLPEISQASAEINKLVAQANIHQTIAPVNPAAFTDPADTMLLASRDPVIREVSVGMTGVEAASYTVSGTPPLSLPNSLGKPLKAWSVDVLPKQDLNGYDSPWPAGGGKNKLDTHTSSEITQTNNGVTFKLKDDIFTVSNEVTSSYPGVTLVSMGLPNLVLPAGTYRLYAFDDTSNYNARLVSVDYSTYLQRNSDTTLTEEVTFTKLVSGTAMTGVTASGSFKLMVVDTSTGVPTAWSPYSNICPISGTDKVNLFVEESYDPTATPKAVLTLPQTVYTGTIGSEGGESRSVLWTANTSTMNNGEDYPGWRSSGIRDILGSGRSDHFNNQRLNIGTQFNINTIGTNDILFLSKSDYHLTQSEWRAMAIDVQIEVILPASTQFSLTTPTISTPTGTATTWATAEDGTVESMEVTYVGKA